MSEGADAAGKVGYMQGYRPRRASDALPSKQGSNHHRVGMRSSANTQFGDLKSTEQVRARDTVPFVRPASRAGARASTTSPSTGGCRPPTQSWSAAAYAGASTRRQSVRAVSTQTKRRDVAAYRFRVQLRLHGQMGHEALGSRRVDEAVHDGMADVHALRPELLGHRLRQGPQRPFARRERRHERVGLDRRRGASEDEGWRVRGAQLYALEKQRQGGLREQEPPFAAVRVESPLARLPMFQGHSPGDIDSPGELILVELQEGRPLEAAAGVEDSRLSRRYTPAPTQLSKDRRLPQRPRRNRTRHGSC